MNKGEAKTSFRVLLGLVLFGTAFAVGLALTYAVISAGADGAPIQSESESLVENNDGSPRVPSVAISSADPGLNSAQQPIGHVSPPASISAPSGQSAPSTVTDKAEEAAASGDPAVEEPSKAASTTPLAWNDLKGRTCRVGLDQVGFKSLSIRKGSVEHGAKVSWQRDFARSRRVERLRADQNPLVLVKGIGVDDKGQPTVAYVESVGTGRTGVISLQVEGRAVPLLPVEDSSGNQIGVD